jgi:hypothetical protein
MKRKQLIKLLHTKVWQKNQFIPKYSPIQSSKVQSLKYLQEQLSIHWQPTSNFNEFKIMITHHLLHKPQHFKEIHHNLVEHLQLQKNLWKILAQCWYNLILCHLANVCKSSQVFPNCPPPINILSNR